MSPSTGTHSPDIHRSADIQSTETGGRVYYPPRAGVLVTDRWFFTNGRRYNIDDLDEMSTRRGLMPVGRRAALEIIAIEAILAVVIVGAVVLVAGPSQVALVVVLAQVMMAATLGVLACLRWRAPMQLWALHRGAPTMLFSTRDETEFGKLCRAAMRAVDSREQRTDHGAS
jgi:Family of unknown function (DUF6232)